MLVAELVNELWFLSGIVSDQYEIPTARQSKSGLRFINTILGEKSMDGNGIVYVTHTTIPLVTGQELYNIPGLITLEELSFQLDTNLRWPTRVKSRSEYFSNIRVDDITTLPLTYHYERAKGGGNIYLYPKPDQSYTLNITGKFENPTNLKLDDDILTSFDDYYVSYLRYEGARRACNNDGTPYNPENQRILQELRSKIEVTPGIDTTMKRRPRRGAANVDGYSQAFVAASATAFNLYTGWEP